MNLNNSDAKITSVVFIAKRCKMSPIVLSIRLGIIYYHDNIHSNNSKEYDMKDMHSKAAIRCKWILIFDICSDRRWVSITLENVPMMHRAWWPVVFLMGIVQVEPFNYNSFLVRFEPQRILLCNQSEFATLL